MAIKLSEHTDVNHIYMRVKLDSGRIEELDVYLRNDGEHIVTTADHCPKNHPEGLRGEIIKAYRELY